MSEASARKLPLRAAQRDVTRSRIRESARELFAAVPFEQVSMEEIARNAKVGRTTIYLHYPTKNALLVELLQEDWDRQARMFERQTAAPLTDREGLERLIRAYAEGLRPAHRLMRVYAFTLSLDENVRKLHRSQRARLIRLLGRAIPRIVTWEDATPDRRRDAAASHGLIAQMEEYGGFLSSDPPPTPADRAVATEVLVDAFARFLEPA